MPLFTMQKPNFDNLAFYIDGTDPATPLENSPLLVRYRVFRGMLNSHGDAGRVTSSTGGASDVPSIAAGNAFEGTIALMAPKAGISQITLSYAQGSTTLATHTVSLQVAARYSVVLVSCHISRTRSNRNDTDIAAISACTKNIGPQTQPKHLGDLQSRHQDYPINLEVGPFDLIPGTPDELCFAYTIVNSGHSGSSEEAVKDALDKISNATQEALDKSYPALSIIWKVLNKITEWLNSLFTANCDGLVVGDKVVLSSDEVDQQTSATGAFAHVGRYDGTDSAIGCGENSLYFATWSVRRTSPFAHIE